MVILNIDIFYIIVELSLQMLAPLDESYKSFCISQVRIGSAAVKNNPQTQKFISCSHHNQMELRAFSQAVTQKYRLPPNYGFQGHCRMDRDNTDGIRYGG